MSQLNKISLVAMLLTGCFTLLSSLYIDNLDDPNEYVFLFCIGCIAIITSSSFLIKSTINCRSVVITIITLIVIEYFIESGINQLFPFSPYAVFITSLFIHLVWLYILYYRGLVLAMFSASFHQCNDDGTLRKFVLRYIITFDVLLLLEAALRHLDDFYIDVLLVLVGLDGAAITQYANEVFDWFYISVPFVAAFYMMFFVLLLLSIQLREQRASLPITHVGRV